MISLLTGWFTPFKAGLLAVVLISFGLLFAHDRYVAGERDDAVKALVEYKARVAALAETQRLENKVKQEEARAKVSLAEVEAQNKIDKVLEQSNETIESLNKKIRGRYEANSTESNMGNVGSIVLPRHASADTTAEATSNSEGITTSESVTDTRIARLEDETKILEDACSVTTIYYNELRAWGDAICEQFVCE